MSSRQTPTVVAPTVAEHDAPSGNTGEDCSSLIDCVAKITRVPAEQLGTIAKNLCRLSRTRQWSKFWTLAAKLLDHYGWGFGVVLPFNGTSQLPDLAIVQVAPQRLPGGRIDLPRFLVFVRRRTWPHGPSWEYLIDPRHRAPDRRSPRLDSSSVVLTDYLEVWRIETSADF